MLVPLSWIADYVKIKMPLKKLTERLTEIGLAVEEIKKEDEEIVLNLETTPNRPDWLSIIGIAREIAAINQSKIKLPKIKDPPKPKKILPIKIVNDFNLAPRETAIIVDKIKIKPSPFWLQKRLKLIGLRPINNLVDITNYVMFEMGNPMHAFDYDKINPKKLTIQKAKGGESFTSVDKINYKLPKGAIIIKNSPHRVIDLCGIKGGLNSAISQNTKTVFLQVIAHYSSPIRRTSQTLSLRSDASLIFERGVNFGGTLEALKRAVNLILELAGGNIASEIFDLKKQEFKPWKLKMRISRANKILGITIPEKEMLKIFESLGLSGKLINQQTLEVTVPTYRGDLKIEEDLIEEIARIYGYNKFPLTTIAGQVPTKSVAYAKDYRYEKIAKNCLKGAGFTEIYSYSLISKQEVENCQIESSKLLKITNPVSQEFEYLRPTLLINLLKAVAFNQPSFEEIKLFELGRVYSGVLPKTKEPLNLSGIITGNKFLALKGVVEILLANLGINNYQIAPYILKNTIQGKIFLSGRSGEILNKNDSLGVIGEIKPSILRQFKIKGKIVAFDFDFSTLTRYATTNKKYVPISKYPAIIEDLSFIVPPQTEVGRMLQLIKQSHQIIQTIELINSYKDVRTFRIAYQSRQKSLTDKEVGKIRKKIIVAIEKEFFAKLKKV